MVIIHNLQIAEGFLLFLSRMLQQFQVRPPHKNFRLVLISTAFEGLSEELTSYCHKYLIEQPSGMRNQLCVVYLHLPEADQVFEGMRRSGLFFFEIVLALFVGCFGEGADEGEGRVRS